MKKSAALLAALALILGLCACSQSAEVTWQEQYDLGVRYLSEGKYEEAVLAFTAAIELDPKQADAYIGLADAYMALGDVEHARQVLEHSLTLVIDADAIRNRLDELTPDEPAPDSPITDALEQYRAIISRADTYVYNEYATGTEEISYQYALVQMAPGDPVPTLLIEQLSDDSFFGFFGYTRVFQYDPESETMRQPDDILMEGVAGAGGYRGSLSMMGDGNGVQVTELSSGTGIGTIYHVTLEGDSLHWTEVWEGMIVGETDNIPASVGIDWHDISDTGAMDSWTTGANTPAAQPGSAQLPTDGDRVVFTGTVRICTYDEVLALQGISDPNPGPYNVERSFTFHLIVLDTPQTMNLTRGDGIGFRDGTASIISVYDANGLEQYIGQHLIFSIDPYQTYWPSDVSLPLGEPRTSDVHVLGPA